jgi:ATP/ADP translocase
MRKPGQELALSFCVFVDMLSVTLVEQFWSLANKVYTSDQGKRWSGLIATAGLLGGVAGGALASFWIKKTELRYSERRRTVQPQLSEASRMLKTQPLRMQHQTGRNALRIFVRIQLVAENGMP